MSTRSYRLLNLLLLGALFAGSMTVYPRLPERIPVHFGASGQPDGWATRSLLSWLALPFIAAGTWLLLEGAAHLAVRHPYLWSVPHKARFLALSPGERAPIVHRLQRFTGLTGVLTMALLLVVQASIYHAATGPTPTLPGYALLAVGMYVVLVLALALRMNARIATLVREAHDRRGAAPER